MRALIITVSTLALALAGCGVEASPVPGPSDFYITGTLSVPGHDEDSDDLDGQDQHECVLADGYDDIHLGAEVLVKDPEGTIIAKGELADGPLASSACIFTFTVSGVPGGHKFYTVGVANRGQLTFTEGEADQPLELTLD